MSMVPFRKGAGSVRVPLRSFPAASTPKAAIRSRCLLGNKINHFFCDEPPILTLSCSNIYFSVMMITVFVGFNLMLTVSVVIFSYMFILAAILKISSASGKKKAFFTRASHLTAVTIFYGTLSYMYLHHRATESQEQEKMASVFYGVVIPMLNPLVYSLRNQDVREALKGIGKKILQV